MSDDPVESWPDVLIHDRNLFARASIESRADELNAPPIRIEIFSWLLEIAAQVTEVSQIINGQDGHLILRGGTTSQLRVPPEWGRGSGDLDGLYRGDEADLVHLVTKLNERLAPCAPFLQFEPFERTEQPIAKFRAWRCLVPRSFGGDRPGAEPRVGHTVLLELHAIEDGTPPPNEVLGGTAFGFTLEVGTTALTRGALIGDKLDCLAVGHPVAIPDGRYAKHARHLYDIEALTGVSALDAETLQDAVDAITYFTARHGEVQGYVPAGLDQILGAVEDFLLPWGWPSGDGSPVGERITRAMTLDQDVPQQRRLSKAGWSVRALDVALIAGAVREAIGDANVAAGAHARRLALVDRVAGNDPCCSRLANEILVALCEQHPDAMPHRKGLRNTLLPKRASDLARRHVALLALTLFGEQVVEATLATVQS